MLPDAAGRLRRRRTRSVSAAHGCRPSAAQFEADDRLRPAGPCLARHPRELDDAARSEFEEPAVMRVAPAFMLGLKEERLVHLGAHPDAAGPS